MINGALSSFSSTRFFGVRQLSKLRTISRFAIASKTLAELPSMWPSMLVCNLSSVVSYGSDRRFILIAEKSAMPNLNVLQPTTFPIWPEGDT